MGHPYFIKVGIYQTETHCRILPGFARGVNFLVQITGGASYPIKKLKGIHEL